MSGNSGDAVNIGGGRGGGNKGRPGSGGSSTGPQRAPAGGNGNRKNKGNTNGRFPSSASQDQGQFGNSRPSQFNNSPGSRNQHNGNQGQNRPGGNSYNQPQNSFGNSGNNGNNDGRSGNHDDFFNIVYSVINERHGGLDDANSNGAQRRSDNFGSAPSYEIVPAVDLSHEFNGAGFPSFGQRQSGSPNYFPASSNQQPNRQRPAQRRSGPNVEVVPVPLRHESTSYGSSSTNPEGESTNDQPYAIPQSVRDIKASNFILNYNPLLSRPTASRDEILVQIIKAEDTYVNDGTGRARPLNGANKHNTQRLPSNFAQVQQPGSSQISAVTPADVTGGRPSSYDVPLNSVGPLARTSNGKSGSFKGYP